MEILVLQHEAEAPAGHISDWASARGHELRTFDVPRLREWPPMYAGDAVISLGAEASVCRSQEPWIACEIAYLKQAHEARVPLLGICFGAQALAAALGAEVRRAPAVAVEWSAPDRLEESLIPAGPWLRWHEDVFSLPPTAHELASADGVPMAFRAGRSVALQFHPEADARIARAWIASCRSATGERAEQYAAVARALELGAEDARRRALELFDRVAGIWLQG